MNPALCPSCSADGWMCELLPGHTGEHFGGDRIWLGNCRRKQTENRVLSALLLKAMWEDWPDGGWVNIDDIARLAALHRDTVRRYLAELVNDELAVRRGKRGDWEWAAA